MATRRMLTASLALALCVPTLMAQDSDPHDEKDPMPPVGESPQDADALDPRFDAETAPAGLLKGSSLLGTSILDATDEECGTVTDLVLDSQGNVAGLLLEINEGDVLVPRDIVMARVESDDEDGLSGEDDTSAMDADESPVRDVESLRLNVAKAKLETAPRLMLDDDAPRINETHVLAAHMHFGRESPLNGHDTTSDRPAPTGADGTSASDDAKLAKDGPDSLCLASKIIDAEVKGLGDEDLGEIADIVVSFDSDKVAYAVLERGGILGMNEKQFAVPYSALEQDETEDSLKLDVSAERLDEAEGFETWPSQADSQLFARASTSEDYGKSQGTRGGDD